MAIQGEDEKKDDKSFKDITSESNPEVKERMDGYRKYHANQYRTTQLVHIFILFLGLLVILLGTSVRAWGVSLIGLVVIVLSIIEIYRATSKRTKI